MYQTVRELLKQKKYQSRLKALYRVDKALQFDDICSDLYLHCTEENISKINLIENHSIVFNFLKKYHKDKRNNKHTVVDDEFFQIPDIGLISELENKEELLEFSNKFKFTDEEVLCILYARNKYNKKRFNYSFIQKSSEKSICYNKLKKYYESIIIKLENNYNFDNDLLNDEELLCLWYVLEGDEIKKLYNYSFLYRKNTKSFSYSKLNKYYNSIILKMLDEIKSKVF